VRERVDVSSLDDIALYLYAQMIGDLDIVEPEEMRTMIWRAKEEQGDIKFSLNFLCNEWNDVVDAWQLRTWESYRDVARLGRKTRLPEKQRETIWRLFETVRSGLIPGRYTTRNEMYSTLADYLIAAGKFPFDFVVVDEAQDLSVPQLRFLAALGSSRPDALFFAGDLGQRIFQIPFSWKSLGVDIRGRSSTLRVNYRTSHQIRAQADRLLDSEVADVDQNVETRTGTVSAFNGPAPLVMECENDSDEIARVAEWVKQRTTDGVTADEIGVFVRSDGQMPRAKAAVEKAGLEGDVLGQDLKAGRGRVSLATMHLSKGLEFRAVVVMACDDEVLPLQERIESVTDDADLEEVYDTERHLLYVACTRARDWLLVTGVKPVSEFLDDLTGTGDAA
jgi:superfamily I DNA/RNA helicase